MVAVGADGKGEGKMSIKLRTKQVAKKTQRSTALAIVPNPSSASVQGRTVIDDDNIGASVRVRRAVYEAAVTLQRQARRLEARDGALWLAQRRRAACLAEAALWEAAMRDLSGDRKTPASLAIRSPSRKQVDAALRDLEVHAELSRSGAWYFAEKRCRDLWAAGEEASFWREVFEFLFTIENCVAQGTKVEISEERFGFPIHNAQVP